MLPLTLAILILHNLRGFFKFAVVRGPPGFRLQFHGVELPYALLAS
jgi:hypothetical protein